MADEETGRKIVIKASGGSIVIGPGVRDTQVNIVGMDPQTREAMTIAVMTMGEKIKALEHVLVDLVRHGTNEERVVAGELLALSKSYAAVEPLLNNLHCENEDVRNSAADALAKIAIENPEENVVSYIITSLRMELEKSNVNADFVSAATRCLSKIQSPLGEKLLLKILDSKNKGTRKRALKMLAQIGGWRSFEEISKRCYTERAEDVRIAAVTALEIMLRTWFRKELAKNFEQSERDPLSYEFIPISVLLHDMSNMFAVFHAMNKVSHIVGKGRKGGQIFKNPYMNPILILNLSDLINSTIVPLINNDNEVVSWNAISALHIMSGWVIRLLESLKSCPQPATERTPQLCEIFGVAETELIKALREKRDQKIRERIIMTLAVIGGEKAENTLVEMYNCEQQMDAETIRLMEYAIYAIRKRIPENMHEPEKFMIAKSRMRRRVDKPSSTQRGRNTNGPIRNA